MIFTLYHNPSETAGLVGETLKQLRLPFTEVRLFDGDGLPRNTSDLEGLIVMGGPMNVDEVESYPFLLSELQLIEKVLANDKPVLGICLGAQLIAKALGSRVYPNRYREVGWHPIKVTKAGAADPAFKSVPSPLNVLHWHGDTFDLPSEAVLLARSERCENQAFRWKTGTYGFQFHIEVTPAMLQDWCEGPESHSYIREAGESPEQILASTAHAYSELEPVAKRILSRLLKGCFRDLLSVA